MATAAEIEALVRRYKVCWEVWPLLHYDDAGVRTQVGFEVDLFGVHTGQAPQPSAEAPANLAVYDALREIAEHVVPSDCADVDCSIEPFDASIHATRKRRYREDVQLQMLLSHKNECEREMDAGELQSLRRIEAALHALGAHKDAWVES